MPAKKYLINLTDEEQQTLLEMTRKGTLLQMPASN
jgi:hypothetical protein